MNSIQELDILEVFHIVAVVATFLLATERALQAIELCKENLVLLNKIIPYMEKQFANLIYGSIYGTMSQAYHRIHDSTNEITYGRKLLAVYHECGETVAEGDLSIVLADIYQSQNKYVEARELYERGIIIMRETGNKRGEAVAYGNLVTLFLNHNEYVKAKEYTEKALAVSTKLGDRKEDVPHYGNLGVLFQYLGEYAKAKECLEKALAIRMEIGDKKGEAESYKNLGVVLLSLGEYVKGKEYVEKALAIATEIGDREKEAASYGILGVVFQSLGEFVKGKEYLEKALAIATEIGDRIVEVYGYVNLGIVFHSLGECVKGKEYLEKALPIATEIGDRKGEAESYVNLGVVFQSLGEYVKAKEYLDRALAIATEIGDRVVEAASYISLGDVFQSLGEYFKAREYLEKAHAIATEIGHRKGEAASYRSLGNVFQSVHEYVKAEKYLENALAIATEIGDRNVKAASYRSLASVFQSLGEYLKAKEYLENALSISMEMGDKGREAACYQNLGIVLRYLGEYVKAEEYLERALVISRETGNKEMEESCYEALGLLFQTLGEDVKAKEYFEKALAIAMEIGNRKIEAICYGNLGCVCTSLREYRKSKQYFDKALAILIKIGDKEGQATCYGNLGFLFQSLGDHVEAKTYYEKALEIGIEIGSKKTEAVSCRKLGSVCRWLDEYDSSEEYLKKALKISKDIKNGEIEIESYYSLALTKLLQGKSQEAFSYLSRSIEKCEELRGLNADSDQIKISLADTHVFPYLTLSELFCNAKDPKSALYVEELGRARGLSDLMATRYSAETPFSADPQSWTDVGKVIKKESNCTCLYISYRAQKVFLWILKTNGAIQFRKFTVDKNTLYTRLAEVAANLDEFFAIMAKSFRSFGILPEELCEDRSLNDIEPKPDSSQEENLTALQQGNDEEDPKPSLSLFYEMLIDPVSEFLEEREIIIVPDRRLYRVPFPALLDKKGKYLSESSRIRIVPSLTTLKLVQDSPADYHSQTDALIVGDPVVGDVIYDGRLNKNFVPLPGARKEAEMLGRMLGVQPLLGEHATKQAVLQRIRSVSLIHFAAHGNPERGEIALAPLASVTGIPQEKDYLLKMTDISQIQVRAQLVVLSCCHSARGQIRAEGVVGIARTFLGSGARSVLVSLWALEDSVTEQLMRRFYEHLIRGESASECLHEAMKWMRDNGFSEVRQWAPFMLIGDNVTFDFGNKVLQEDTTLSMEEARETDGEK